MIIMITIHSLESVLAFWQSSFLHALIQVNNYLINQFLKVS